MSTAFLYPGQGAQRPGMLHDLPDTAAVRRTLDEARETRPDLDDLDTADALAATTAVQLCLLVAGVASARHLVDDRGVEPSFVAGHSVGAFAAAVTAGVLHLGEAVDVVGERGRLMAQACAGGDYGMAALLGLAATAAQQLVDEVGDDDLWVANVNAADQTVLAGTVDALARAEPAARDAGARELRRLDVSIASHCPLQQPTADRLAEHLAGVPRRRQEVAYLTNVGGRRVRRDAGAVLDDLAAAVARPVRWYDAMRLVHELGADRFEQMPPGRALLDLARVPE